MRILIIVWLLCTLSSCNPFKNKLNFDKGDIEFSSEIDKAEASALYKILNEEHYFTEAVKVARIKKEKNIYQVLIINENASLNDQTYISKTKNIGSKFSEQFLGEKPVEVWVCDKNFDRQLALNSMPANNKIQFSSGIIYYKENVNKEDAENLATFFEKNNTFHQKGETIQLSFKDNNYELKIVNGKDLKPDLKLTKVYMGLAKKISAQVFKNKPVVVHLCDERFQILQTILPS